MIGSPFVLAKFWYQPPSLVEFLNQTVENRASLDITRANYIFGLYKESFESLTTFINRQD